MSKDLDKRLQMYIAKMAIKFLPYGMVWNSSAKQLQDDLHARGIEQKLYYEYKLPENKTPAEFMNQIVLEYFCNHFYTDFAGAVFRDKKLSGSEKMAILKYVFVKRRETKGKMKLYAQEIQKLNPELSDITVERPFDFVSGAMFGFAPDEIRYFMKGINRDFDAEEKYLKLLQDKYGLKVGYVLAPQTVKKILVALNKKVKNIHKERYR